MGISSSHKKKRPRKNSSQGRTKKKSKSRNRRYNKSKKIHLHDDSLSHSSDDDSRSFMSVSCSSSEDNHRSRRARSRTRKDSKGSKKKVRRRSLSHDRSESHCLRKTIGTKRKGGSDLGTKPHKKKRKPSRDVSVSSTSSVSRSCDTRQVRSTSSHGREFEKRSHRGRYEGREREKRKLNKVRSGTKRNRYRSRSCSSCSRNSEDNEYWSDVKEAGENNVKRLRSVIMVIEEEEEGRLSDNDEHKEEIVYDNDDYPSCRSNDSNDGGHKRELDHQSNVACDNNMMVENEKGEEPVVLNIRTTELPENFKDVEGQCCRSNPSSCVVGANDFVKAKVTEVSDSLNGEDLESTLRQRALENLRKFRGGFQPNANTPTGKKDNSYEDVKQSSAVKSEIVQINFPKGNGVKTVGAKSQKEDGSKSLDATQELKEISVPALRSDSNCYSQKNKITSSGSVDDHQSVTVKQEIACVPDLVAVAGQLSEKVNSAVVSVINIPKLATPVMMRHNSLKNQNTLKQRSASDEPHQTNLLVTESSSAVCAAETAETMAPTSNNNNNNNNNNEDIKNACGPAASECSSVKSTLALNDSNKSQDATTDSSQFEQKTMTVMRGGEMVQVSYKVYIPKKAPAFTRRQLKR